MPDAVDHSQTIERAFTSLPSEQCVDVVPYQPSIKRKCVRRNVAASLLVDLQGVQRSACVQMPKIAANGGEMRDPLIPGLAITEEKCGQLVVEEGTGRYTAEEYDQAVYDITNFLYYVGDPSRLERHRLGVYVLLFLVILFVFTWLLGREYNKAVR